MPELNRTDLKMMSRRAENCEEDRKAREAAMDLLRRDFPHYCINLRVNLRLTQTKFAELMGIGNLQGKITVSRWESGWSVPQRRYLERFMEIQKEYDDRVSSTSNIRPKRKT